MTSEIRLNTLKNRVGLGTVSFTNTGPVVSGIVTANSFSATGDLDIDGHTNLDNLNVVGVSTFNGDINIDDDLKIKRFTDKIGKAYSIWVFEVGTSRGHKPIIDQSCGPVIFSLIELIEIYLPVTFPG